MDAALAIDFLSATVRIATPILMAAMGGILIERAGTFAVGLEGMMLSGAFSGVVGAYLSGSIVMGLVAACVGGLMFGVIIAIATTRFDTEHMVTGLAANLLALGFTSFALRTIIGRGQAPVIHTPLLEPIPIPFLADIPVLGALLFRSPRSPISPSPPSLRSRCSCVARAGVSCSQQAEKIHSPCLLPAPIRSACASRRCSRAASSQDSPVRCSRCNRSAPSPTA